MSADNQTLENLKSAIAAMESKGQSATKSAPPKEIALDDESMLHVEKQLLMQENEVLHRQIEDQRRQQAEKALATNKAKLLKFLSDRFGIDTETTSMTLDPAKKLIKLEPTNVETVNQSRQ